MLEESSHLVRHFVYFETGAAWVTRVQNLEYRALIGLAVEKLRHFAYAILTNQIAGIGSEQICFYGNVKMAALKHVVICLIVKTHSDGERS